MKKLNNTKKDLISWILIVAGSLLLLVGNIECCHFFNVEWIASSLSSLVFPILLATLIAKIISLKTKSFGLKLFAKTYFIMAIVLMIGTLYKIYFYV